MSGADNETVAVHPLHGNQMHAVAPEHTVWLSASAGTGKTQVLASRVLRLLLQPGVEPSQILCLTFTKAGATEMAARINSQLAQWVRLSDTHLFARLEAIGADGGPATIARARTLFAAVLDCPGGGLRIDTIHAFAQWLLGAFPEEAGLLPGTRAMEDRDRVLLLRQVLADLLVHAETDPLGDPQLLEAVSALSLRMGAEQVERFLRRCAEAQGAWTGPGGWQAADMRANVLRLLGLPADASTETLAAMCEDEVFDVASLRRCLDVNHAWGTKTGLGHVDTISEWLLGHPGQRVEGLAALGSVFLTKDGSPRASKSHEKHDPDYPTHCERVVTCIKRIAEQRALLALADRLVPALRLGRAFALAWDAAKRREGLIDFDDQIRAAAQLLTTSDHSQWIGYKLDRRFDHILVDEAQDTNAAQWRIIDALTQEFFAGQGQHGDLLRTLFVVGDYKQAIFRFQGTSPENFEAARARVEAEMSGAADNARRLRGTERARELRQLGLDRSFRSAQPVLDFVDRAIDVIGHENFGLRLPPERHVGEARPGYVALWRPVGKLADSEDNGAEPTETDGDGASEGWLSRSDRQMADRIARQVRSWIDGGYPLVKGRTAPRRATAGDVMVLVRKRRDLAGLIVARLHAAGVPVAGVDRLRLGAPLAVRDLVAALRFAAQPLDDLNLACLLTSPLLGWSQEDLLAHGYREGGVKLWHHLRQSRESLVARTLDQLGELLRLADYEPPQALLHWLLVGPWQGRRKLIARLGREAGDPIDELLNAANAFAGTTTPSLVGFLRWFDAGEGELKREAGGGGDFVRVMTVHGAKGLQAPIVILADAAGNPADRRGGALTVPDPHNTERLIPLPPLAKDERVGRLAEVQATAERAEIEEHWRLLYVAMTRAEEALFIGGPLAARETSPAAESWFAKLQQLFGTSDWLGDEIWSARLDWGVSPTMLGRPPAAHDAVLALPPPLPRWLESGPSAEPRPPRPLAPSAAAEDVSADPPFAASNDPGAGVAAAQRGVLIHRLLERLPEVAQGERALVGARWLDRNASTLDPQARAALLGDALAVLDDPRWTELFAPGALAEVPIAATVGERVIAGTIDRLLVLPDRIRLIDYKSTRRVPLDAAEVPTATVRQLAAYVLALEAVYPGRTIEAAVLYTSAPALIALPDALLEPHKRALTGAE